MNEKELDLVRLKLIIYEGNENIGYFVLKTTVIFTVGSLIERVFLCTKNY